MTNDMTKGSPIKLILSFMVPLLIGNIFQQFYNMADTIIVGRTISVEALAAVGATGSISFLIVGFVQGVTSGFANVITTNPPTIPQTVAIIAAPVTPFLILSSFLAP